MMMKNRYLIITQGIGGGQLYVASKVEHLKNVGWNVKVGIVTKYPKDL